MEGRDAPLGMQIRLIGAADPVETRKFGSTDPVDLLLSYGRSLNVRLTI
jgi:hypothetical protein